jgi:hypothetical protein
MMEFEEWLEHGIVNGFCSKVVCGTHDGWPVSETEEELYSNGADPCSFLVRLGTEVDWEADALSYKEL